MTEATQPYSDVAFVRINKDFLFHKNYNYNKILQISLIIGCGGLQCRVNYREPLAANVTSTLQLSSLPCAMDTFMHLATDANII